MALEHKDLLGEALHNPKGFDDAVNGTVGYKNGIDTLEWIPADRLKDAINSVDPLTGAPTETDGDVYLLSAAIVNADVTAINWQSGTTVRITFGGGYDLSTVTVGMYARLSGSDQQRQNGRHIVTAVEDGSDYIEVTNAEVTAATYDTAAGGETTAFGLASWDGGVGGDQVTYSSSADLWYPVEASQLTEAYNEFDSFMWLQQDGQWFQFSGKVNGFTGGANNWIELLDTDAAYVTAGSLTGITDANDGVTQKDWTIDDVNGDLLPVNDEAQDIGSATNQVAAIFIGAATGAMVTVAGVTADADGTFALGENAASTDDTSTAVGKNSTATAFAAAIGEGASATAVSSLAVGRLSVASNTNASAFGLQAVASGNGSTALGYQAEAIGLGATAVGYGSTADASGSVAFGFFATTASSGINQVALGNSAVTGASSAIAVGGAADASGARSIAIGASASSAGDDSVVIGYQSISSGKQNLVLGAQNSTGTGTHGDGYVSLGYNTNAGTQTIGNDSVSINTGTGGAGGIAAVAIGDGSSANGLDSVSMGNTADASNTDCIAIGADSVASGSSGVSFGPDAVNAGSNAVCIGSLSSVSVLGTGAISIGTASSTSNQSAIAIGASSSSTGLRATSIGPKTLSSGVDSVIVGSGGAGLTLSNSTDASVALGSDSDTPSMYVFGGTGVAGTNGAYATPDTLDAVTPTEVATFTSKAHITDHILGEADCWWSGTEWIHPLQAASGVVVNCFIDCRDATGTISIDNTDQAIVLDTTKSISSTGGYTVAASAITIVEDGTYRIRSSVAANSIDTSGGARSAMITKVFINAVEDTDFRGHDYQREVNNTNYRSHAIGEGIVALTAGDVITLTVTSTVNNEPVYETIAGQCGIIIERKEL